MIKKENLKNIKDLNLKYIIRDNKNKKFIGLVQGKDNKVYGVHFVRVNPDLIIDNKVDYIEEDTRYYLYVISFNEINITQFNQYKKVFDTTSSPKFLNKDDFYMKEIVFGLTFEQYVKGGK